MFLQEVALTTFPLKYFLFCLERNETRSFSFLQGENRETDDLVFVANANIELFSQIREHWSVPVARVIQSVVDQHCVTSFNLTKIDQP